MSKLLKAAMDIYELAVVLENVTTDDQRPLETWTNSQILHEARHVLSLFHEGGTAQAEMLQDPDPAVRRDARQQIRKLQKILIND